MRILVFDRGSHVKAFAATKWRFPVVGGTCHARVSNASWGPITNMVTMMMITMVIWRDLVPRRYKKQRSVFISASLSLETHEYLLYTPTNG